jgi:hypothetical protein
MLHAAALEGLSMTTVRSWAARLQFDEVIAICDELGTADARDTLETFRESRAGRTIDSL